MAQRGDLGAGVDLGVAVGGGQVGVAEPAADHVDLDPGFEEVNSGGVAECVWADGPVLAWLVEMAGVTTNDFVDPVSGERLPGSRNEHGLIGRLLVGAADEVIEHRRGLCPKGAGAPFVAFAV